MAKQLTPLEKALFSRLRASYDYLRAVGFPRAPYYEQMITGKGRDNLPKYGDGVARLLDADPDVLPAGLVAMLDKLGIEKTLRFSMEADVLDPIFLGIPWLTPERLANAHRRLRKVQEIDKQRRTVTVLVTGHVTEEQLNQA